MKFVISKGSNNADKRQAPRFLHHLQQNVSIKAGETAELTCQVTGCPQPYLLWFRDNVKIKDGNDFTIG